MEAKTTTKTKNTALLYFCGAIIAGVVMTRGYYAAESWVVDEWSRYKRELVARTIIEGIGNRELVVDPAGMKKKEIAEMNKDDLLRANWLLRTELEQLHGQLESVAEIAKVGPMFNRGEG